MLASPRTPIDPFVAFATPATPFPPCPETPVLLVLVPTSASPVELVAFTNPLTVWLPLKALPVSKRASVEEGCTPRWLASPAVVAEPDVRAEDRRPAPLEPE